MITEEHKASQSRAFGRNYLVFDGDGNEFSAIRGRLLMSALADARKCDGEIWLDGKCVVPKGNA